MGAAGRMDESREDDKDQTASTVGDAVADDETVDSDAVEQPKTVEEVAVAEPLEPESAEVLEEPAVDQPEAVEEPEAVESSEPEVTEVLEEPEAVESSEPEVAEVVEDPETVESEAAEPSEPEPAEVLEEPAPQAQPGSPVEVEPALEAAVEEAFEGADMGEEGEEAKPLREEIPGDWFVVHTYSGYENKVKANLETRIISMNMEEKIYEVVIPTEDVVEVKSGKKQTVQRKVLPGYVLVRMDLDDDSWYVVRNTPNVTGFVGSANHPIPLSEKEADRILRRKEEAERPKPKAEWSVNDAVRVTTGPFANFQGVISDVDGERQKVKVLVNIFGRETPVELSFDQISKV